MNLNGVVIFDLLPTFLSDYNFRLFIYFFFFFFFFFDAPQISTEGKITQYRNNMI